MRNRVKHCSALRRAALTGACTASFGLIAAAAAAAPPTIESQSVSDITETSATLEATINPDSDEDGAYYQFQLVSDPSEYWPEVTCPEERTEPPFIPCHGPHGTVGGPPPAASIKRRPGDLPTEGVFGPDGVPVSLDLEEAGVVLEPGTTYHYRVIAVERGPAVDTIVWEAPPTYGADQTFVTAGGESPEGPPVVDDPPLPIVSLPIFTPPPAIVPAVDPPPQRRCPRPSKAQVRHRVQGNRKAKSSKRRCRRHSRGPVAQRSVASGPRPRALGR